MRVFPARNVYNRRLAWFMRAEGAKGGALHLQNHEMTDKTSGW